MNWICGPQAILSSQNQAKSLLLKRSSLCNEDLRHLIKVSHSGIDPIFSHETTKLLQHSSGLVAWKDRHSRFLGCNFNFATLANLKSPAFILGKKDTDFSWGQDVNAAALKMEDDLVLNGFIVCVLGQYAYGTDQKIVFVKKTPILNEKEEIIGIFNALTTFYPENILSVIKALQHHEVDLSLGLLDAIKQLFFSCSHLLSPREEECAYFLLKGLTAKEMAKRLALSHRTIEAHLTHLKEKLQCKKMNLLIIRLVELGFLDNIPSHLLLNA